jgi:ribulose-5-phosphate 4-epimerase/fuculose-1-phosphate aldolase
MLLRNHGTLAVGGSAGDAFLGIFFLERACRQQAMALTAGADQVLLASQAARDEVKAQTAALPMVASLAWPALKRKLARRSPGYDT